MDARREARYQRIFEQLQDLIEGVSPSLTAAMATLCAVLHAKMPHHSWTGFYLVSSLDEMHVGPYQGPVACQTLRGQGVCLEAARGRTAIVVPDVNGFPGHIACDPRTRSEIVVPVIHDAETVAVLDIDSHDPAQFTSDDIAPLQRIIALLDPFLEDSDAA